MNLSALDLNELERRGINAADLVSTIHQFTTDTHPLKLERPCVPGDGIVVLSATECHMYQGAFDELKKNKRILKFVPASGAASRMFKHLFNYNPTATTDLVEEFIIHFERFPFIDALAEAMQRAGLSLEASMANNEWPLIFDFILHENGLGYAGIPKGMVLFHKYHSGARTAFEEHLHEAVGYAKEYLGVCRIHFTVPVQHRMEIETFLEERAAAFLYEEFDLSFSVQSEKTDMIALDRDNEPLRDAEGKLVFRPAGHGALIHNLAECDADVVFIKNIDNITTDALRGETIFYKQILAGYLLKTQHEIHELLHELENESQGALERALEYIQEKFQPSLPLGMSIEELRSYAKGRLDRPLRICGMVRNEGEPGGGPFWVRMDDGTLTKQIVERSQIDPHEVQQNVIFEEATHFNPVDIVCSIKDRHGKNYALQNYIDHSTGFVSEKFMEGKVIKALELPGLWNGAMALWNTVFVEVPISTFTPVKTVNDLLRPGHQVTDQDL